MPTRLSCSVTELIGRLEARSVSKFLDSNLEYVKISNLQYSQINLLPYLFSLGGCPRLYIELRQVNLEFVRQIGFLLSTGQCPPNLIIHYTSPSDINLETRVVVEVLASALASGRCPQNLSLSFATESWHRAMNDAGAEILANVLETGQCPQGLSLDLSKHSCSLVGIKRIADALETGRCPMNLGIRLADSEISIPCVEVIARSLACTKCPIGLNLNFRTHFEPIVRSGSRCAINPRGAEIIARALQWDGPQNLSIDLCSNVMGITGANAFADVFLMGRYPATFSIDLSYTGEVLHLQGKVHMRHRDASMIADALASRDMRFSLGNVTTGYPDIDVRIAEQISVINRTALARIAAHTQDMRLYGTMPVPPDLLADHMRTAFVIDTEEMHARIKLMMDANRELRSARIRQRIRPASIAASKGFFKATYRGNSALIDDLISSDYIPHREDLSLLNQVAFSIETELTNSENTMKGRMIEFLLSQKHNYMVSVKILRGKMTTLLPQQLKTLIIDVTASNSLEDLINSHMYLLSADNTACIVFSFDYYKKFLLNDNSPQLREVEWAHLYLFRKSAGEEEYKSSILGNLGEVFDIFPMFKNAYWGLRDSLLTSYITLLFSSNEFVLIHIKKALNSPSSRDKLIDMEQQQMLIACLRTCFQVDTINFDNAHMNNGAILTPAALADIFRIFEYTNALPEKKNFLLLGLSLIFVELSSQRFLGTDVSSPIALRLFAVALLNHVQNDAPFFSQIQSWKNRLLGILGAFTCTAVVASILFDCLKTHRPELLQLIFPKAWK